MTLEPSRITLARLRVGLGKAELAERLGATPRTITNYETHGAPDRAAPALAEALGCLEPYLRLPPAAPLEEDRVFFRARRRSTAAQKHQATSVGRTGVELYQLITGTFQLPGLSVPNLDGMGPEEAAQRLRIEWGLGLDPVPNSVRLAESKGARVLTLPDATADVDAFSVWEDGRPYVFLSMLKSAERSRFDLAHEIGHLVLHGTLAVDSERDAEREADRFASELLIPTLFLRSRVGRDPSLATVLKVKQYLGVSAMAAAFALHRAGMLSEWSYRQTCTELARRGYRSREPSGMPRETSKVFETVLPALRRSKRWGTDAIASRLGVKSSEVHELTFGQALTDLEPERVAGAGSDRSRAHLSVVG